LIVISACPRLAEPEVAIDIADAGCTADQLAMMK